MRLPTSSRAPLSRRTRFFLVIAVSASALLGGTLVAATGHPAAPASPGSAGANARAAQGSAPYIFFHDPTMAREGGTYYLFSTGDPAGAIGNGNDGPGAGPRAHRGRPAGKLTSQPFAAS